MRAVQTGSAWEVHQKELHMVETRVTKFPLCCITLYSGGAAVPRCCVGPRFQILPSVTDKASHQS